MDLLLVLRRQQGLRYQQKYQRLAPLDEVFRNAINLPSRDLRAEKVGKLSHLRRRKRRGFGGRNCGDGAQRRIRTTDTRIFSPLLYQLSYLGLCRLTGSPAGFHEGTRRRPLKARGL